MVEQSKNSCNFVRRRRKSNLVQVLGGKCLLCGFDTFQEALDFHHINPEEKEFNFASNIKSLEAQLQELKKCILVCSNCHRGIHAGYYTIPDDWQNSFNEELAKSLLKDLEKKHYFCHSCGKEISKQASYCVECSHKLQQRFDRPSREELKQLIRTIPFVSIGEKFGVSDNAIRKWCKSYGLPSKKKEISTYSEEEWSMV